MSTPYKNPFRRWLETQPRTVTQTSIARQVGCDRSYVSDLMSEQSIIFPSLDLAIKIKDATGGKVLPEAMHAFAVANRRAKERAAA